ncbi:hypothetical protein L227DRAFT_611288 [Lentinus tigrinus ALCF2SS1-6]|uniref:Uncharacterized protein n=1 Tax=Lentinus tigrinus ALCF2SS1-6 TaxID=1328759 RepID=A0A5C2S9E1_9APHY|nr:hypothetical protein L227DRAFT_611288 [Lentinus tigrinus ALCF2SS1-6]
MFSLAKLVSYSTLAVAVLASEDSQTLLQSPLPRHQYVDCGNDIWSGRILECGQLEVPLDWKNAGGSITLNYTALPVKRRAPRKGTLFMHLGHEYLGRTFNPEHALNMLFSQRGNIAKIAPEYDLVMWTYRNTAVSQRTECFADNEEKFSYSPNPYAQLNNATVAFYNTTFRGDLLRELPWDREMAWSETQGPQDVKDMLGAQERMVTQCLNASPDRDMFQYGGTAASVRDLVALADALDGPGSPVNLWTKHHGSILASHLLTMFPERVGRVVMDDPVDPIAYQERPSHIQWSSDVAIANNTLARIQQHGMINGSTGYMQFFGRPAIDEVRFGQVTRFLHSELVEWHTRAEADYQQILHKKENELWLNPEERDFRIFHMGFIRQGTGVNGWRSGNRRWSVQVLDGMPLVCGDSLHEHNTDVATVRGQIEESLIEHMNGGPLIATSAFPPLRYLCHLWPVRAVERVRLGNADEPSLSNKVLVLLRDQDYWNYFSVSEDTAHQRWPTANVVSGLHYGDLALDHDQCSYDIIKAFYGTGELPTQSRKCQYDEEELSYL